MAPNALVETPSSDVLRCGMEIVIRDLRPEDEALYPDFHAEVTARDRRLRFFSPAPIGQVQAYRLTHFDPADAIALAAIGRADGKLYGVSRLHRIKGDLGEFAVMVRSDLKGQGLGRRLLQEVIDHASTIGISRIVGLILPENAGMLALVRELGFDTRPDPDEAGVLRASIDVRKARPKLAAA